MIPRQRQFENEHNVQRMNSPQPNKIGLRRLHAVREGGLRLVAANSSVANTAQRHRFKSLVEFGRVFSGGFCGQFVQIAVAGGFFGDDGTDVQFEFGSVDQIRIYGASNPDVVLNLLRIIAEIAPVLHRATDRDVLMQHAGLIGTDAGQIADEADRQRVQQRLRDTLHALAQSDTEAT